MPNKNILLSVLIITMLALSAGVAWADEVTSEINYQGRLADSSGSPLTGTYTMTFRLYNVSTKGMALATDKHDVEVTDGLFNTGIDFGTSDFDGGELWLGVAVGADSEMTPRQELRPVPYALSLVPGAVINGSVSGPVLEVKNDADWSCGVYASTTGFDSDGVQAYTTGDGSHGVYASTTGFDSDGVQAYTTGDGSQGVYTRAYGDYSDGVWAFSAKSYGVFGRSDSTDKAGVYARGKDRGADLILGGNANTVVGDDGKIYSDPAYASSDIYLVTNDCLRIDLDNDGSGEDADFEIRDKDDTLLFNVDDSGTTTIRGNLIVKSSSTGSTIIELGEGLDYAEGFDVSDNAGIAAGTVLSIDADNPGKLTISDTPYDTRVAGIVAGASGMGSGVRIGVDQFDYDVALAGRVYCNVDATEERVEPGDMLTTSATPGYAMKSTDYTRERGAILGKAMQRLEKGEKGQILVLVTLQ